VSTLSYARIGRLFFSNKGWAYKTVADSDALVVKILRNAGAILYVKTQNPQTLLVSDTVLYV
jgi:Asp-tRNA(Asn)/Glu-tRNA(Gln) amidotransferase A subunit family amidase